MKCTKKHLAAVERRLRMYDKMVSILVNGGIIEQADKIFYKCDICKSHANHRNCTVCCISDNGEYESCNKLPYFSSVVYRYEHDRKLGFYTRNHATGSEIRLLFGQALLNALKKRHNELLMLLDINGFCVVKGRIVKKLIDASDNGKHRHAKGKG